MALWQGLAGPFRGSGGGASEGKSVYLSVIELFHAAPAAVLRVTLRGGEDMNDSRYCVIFLPSSLLFYLLICFFLSRSSLSFPSLWCSAVVLFLVFISRVRVSAMDPQGVWPRVWEIPLFSYRR